MTISAPSSQDQRDDGPNSPYRAAMLGFKEYWYPVCKSSEVTRKPMGRMLLGEPVMLVRREGVVYATADECPHRGTKLSIGYDEFPGTKTIVCRYHGWTFDLKTGNCVAVLCEGPKSAAVGTARVRTYPVQERVGIVWIWMGKRGAVPLEDDVPRFLLRPDTVAKVRYRVLYGNWRWHAENVAGGHAQLVHKYSIRQYFERPVAYPSDLNPHPYEDGDGEGIIPGYRFLEHNEAGSYPGFGDWPRVSWLRRLVLALTPNPPFRPVEGLTESMLRLPGIYRVLHHPTRDCIYYEWWVPVDADHYTYFQVTTAHPKSWRGRVRFNVIYYLWGRPIGVVLFNNQDAAMVRQTTNFAKRNDGWIYLSRATRQDLFHMLWRKLCNEQARGVGRNAAADGSAERAAE